jgi:hypothetical protein
MSVALILLVIAAIQTSLPPVPGAAVLAGRVTELGSDRPLPRIFVTLLDPHTTAQLEEATDEDGRYRFHGVPPGAYVLSAGPARHRSTHLPQRFGAERSVPLNSSAPNLHVDPGETRLGLDFSLSRSLSIEGRVLAPWQNPLTNVQVIVMGVDENSQVESRVYTDDRGAYRAYGLAPGRYRVCAHVDQRSMGDIGGGLLRTTCYPSTADSRTSGDVVLASGDATGVDVRVQQFSTNTFSVAGTVVDAGGALVTAASVHAYGIDGDVPPASGATDRGTFVLSGLVPGRYLVRAWYAGTSPDAATNHTEQVGYATADLSGGDAGGVVVSMSKLAEVRGTVTFEGLRSGSRRTGMSVQTSPLAHRLVHPDLRSPSARVDEDLSFTLQRVARLPLLVRLGGLPDGWVLKSVTYGGRDVTYVPTDLGDEASSAPLTIVLTNRTARRPVIVQDRQGRPAPSAYVVALPTDPSRSGLPFAAIPATRTTEGDIVLGPMLPGEYFVAALSPDDERLLRGDPGRVAEVAAVGSRVTLTETQRGPLALSIVALPSR